MMMDGKEVVFDLFGGLERLMPEPFRQAKGELGEQ